MLLHMPNPYSSPCTPIDYKTLISAPEKHSFKLFGVFGVLALALMLKHL